MISTVVSSDRKSYSESAGGTEDAEHKSLENVKKNKKRNKQTSKSKRKTVEIHNDDETENSRVFEDNTANSKQVSYILVLPLYLTLTVCTIVIVHFQSAEEKENERNCPGRKSRTYRISVHKS